MGRGLDVIGPFYSGSQPFWPQGNGKILVSWEVVMPDKFGGQR